MLDLPKLEALAFLPDESLSRLRRSIRANISIRAISPPEVRSPIAWRSNSLYIIDPSLLSADEFASFAERMAATGCRFLIYAMLTRSVTKAIVLAQMVIPVEVIGVGAQSEGNVVADTVGRLASPSVSALVLCRLAARLERLPPRLLTASVGLFSWLPIPDSAELFVASATYPVRTAHEKFRRARLHGAERLRVTGQLSRAFPDIAEGDESLQAIAERWGFSGSATLSYAFRNVFGVSVSRLTNLTAAVAANRIAEWVELPAV